MFEHPRFDRYSFEEIPLNRDVFLMDQKYMEAYEEMLLHVFNGETYEHIGEVGFCAPRKVGTHSVEMSWYPNVHTRFHEVTVSLPRDQFVYCVGCRDCDEKPHIFVKTDWIESLYLRSYCVFGLVDAIGVKSALENQRISRDNLITLRNEVDQLSRKYPEIIFISFADSLLIKSNWTPDYHRASMSNTYDPEILIHLAQELDEVYMAVLGLHTYAILTQGSNEYYEDPALHVSESGNHISLNSLGIPFAQLQSIDSSARRAIRNKVHPPAELYMDALYFHSLKFKYGFEKHREPSNCYETKMVSGAGKYYYSSIDHIVEHLDDEE